MCLVKASKIYGVPTTTLIGLIKNRTLISNQKDGRNSTLSRELQYKLRNYILEMEKPGFGLTHRGIRSLPYQLLERNNIKPSFCRQNMVDIIP